MQHLTLQIGFLHFVVVDQGQRADAGRGQIQRRRRTEPAGADQRDARLAEFDLPGGADFRQQQVARVAVGRIGVEARRRRPAGRPPASGESRR